MLQETLNEFVGRREQEWSEEFRRCTIDGLNQANARGLANSTIAIAEVGKAVQQEGARRAGLVIDESILQLAAAIEEGLPSLSEIRSTLQSVLRAQQESLTRTLVVFAREHANAIGNDNTAIFEGAAQSAAPTLIDVESWIGARTESLATAYLQLVETSNRLAELSREAARDVDSKNNQRSTMVIAKVGALFAIVAAIGSCVQAYYTKVQAQASQGVTCVQSQALPSSSQPVTPKP